MKNNSQLDSSNSECRVLERNLKRTRLRATLLPICFATALVAVFPALSIAQKATSARPPQQHLSTSLKEQVFHSNSLQKEMRYRILLPTGYAKSEKRYPTLYLLHGLYGDYRNWSTLTNLVGWAEGLQLIIAMPDAGNSWYVNSATESTDKYEDYIVQDFVAEVDSHFRTIADRHARAIAGLSMGGYAALNLSMKHLSLFSYAGGISAALNAPSNLDEKQQEFRDGLQRVFGSHGNANRSENDVFSDVTRAGNLGSLQIYLDCGEDDIFLEVNRELATRLKQRKAAYEYHEMPGGHTWEYWDAAIPRFLDFLCRKRFVVSRS